MIVKVGEVLVVLSCDRISCKVQFNQITFKTDVSLMLIINSFLLLVNIANNLWKDDLAHGFCPWSFLEAVVAFKLTWIHC